MSASGALIPRSRARRAALALFLVTVTWGWAFVWMKQGVLAAERVLGPDNRSAGIGLFNGVRFGIAALVMALVPACRRGLSGRVWRGGLVLGLLLVAGFLFQMIGLAGVSPAVSAFLTSLYVLFTAILLALRTGRRLGPWMGAGVVLATLGGAYIGGPPQLTFGLAEWLTVACAFVFAVHILATDAITRREPPMPITLATFVVVALASLAFAALALLAPRAPAAEELAELLRSRDFLQPMILSCAFPTVIGLTLMNAYQRDLDPVRAAILYALEPVWAAAISIALGFGGANLWLWIGGSALLAGNFLAELGPALSRRNTARATAAEGAPAE